MPVIIDDEQQRPDDTAHLLRSPANAARLLRALQRALNDEGETTTVDDLRHDLSGAAPQSP